MKSYKKGKIFVKVDKRSSSNFKVIIEVDKKIIVFEGSEDEIFHAALSLSRPVARFILECIKNSATL